MAHHGITRGIGKSGVGTVFVAAVVHAAQVEELLESQVGVIAQAVRDLQIVLGSHGEGELAQRQIEVLNALAQHRFQSSLQGVNGNGEGHGFQRAMVFSRRILFCNCKMP